ncbi:MAG: hypothetical protein OEM82_15935 [Acidobacteriota bacterium]|nr:hypothetical protein [Acidobacteriota bacterium]MDH3530723.1 hypothetical protein [Acidobacteriota bacterium]
MAKKFDTNPLDPDFPERAKKEVGTQELHTATGATRAFADPLETEEQTRKLEDPDLNGLETEPLKPAAPMVRLASDPMLENKKHSIGSVKLPENVLMALPYIPFAYIGLIAGIIELFFIPRNEPRVRYHAAQGVAAHLGIALVSMILGFASIASDLAGTASTVFGIITTIMLIVFAVKAWQGKPIHIETVESLTDWLEEKISPQK